MPGDRCGACASLCGRPPLTVLYRRGQLGDVVLLGSVTKAIGKVTVVTDPRWHAIARRLEGVEEVRATLPSGPHVDLQRRRLGPSIRKRSIARRLWLYTGWPDPPRPSVPELYAEAVGVRPAPLPWIRLPARPRETLALIPGASVGLKRWRPDAFAAVGRRWSGPVVVLGGPGEEELCGWVARAVPGADVVVERGFEITLDVLAGVHTAVTGDTGLMHLAGATGARVLALFGPTHPADGFFVYPGEVVQRDLPCRPCSLHRTRRCHRGDHGCLAIAPERVVALL